MHLNDNVQLRNGSAREKFCQRFFRREQEQKSLPSSETSLSTHLSGVGGEGLGEGEGAPQPLDRKSVV